MLSRLVIAFLPMNKHLLISWLESPSSVILEPKKIKSLTVSIFSPICHGNNSQLGLILILIHGVISRYYIIKKNHKCTNYSIQKDLSVKKCIRKTKPPANSENLSTRIEEKQFYYWTSIKQGHDEYHRQSIKRLQRQKEISPFSIVCIAKQIYPFHTHSQDKGQLALKRT